MNILKGIENYDVLTPELQVLVPKASKKLKEMLQKGLDTNLEGEPILKLKNGKRLVIEETFGNKYNVYRDFGCTSKPIKSGVLFDELVRIVLIEGSYQ